MTEIQIDYVNYEHGGRPGSYRNDSGPAFSYRGLVRIMSTGQWPDILVMGEGDRYRFDGMRGAFEAAEAMRNAGGRAYMPLIGSLPREWGPFAPIVFVDIQTINVLRWYDDVCADFAALNRNLLVATLPGRTEEFQVVAIHGDIDDEQARLADAKKLHRLAKPAIPCAIVGDFNTTLSGPQWEPQDLNDPEIYPPDEPWRLGWRRMWEHGPAQTGPIKQDTTPLDYLCGYWFPDAEGGGERKGGMGFYDAAELAQDFTPTQLPRPNGRQPSTIDHILLNKPWAQAMVAYQVHQPVDPAAPDSDHLRISVVINA